MKLKFTLLVVLIAFNFSNTFAQNKIMAKAFYEKAREAYAEEKWEKALSHLEKTKEYLEGNTNPDIMYLEVKSLYNSGADIDKTKVLCNRFLKEADENDTKKEEIVELLINMETDGAKISVFSVIDRHIKAIGGEHKMDTITTFYTHIEASTTLGKVVMYKKYKAPDKLFEETPITKRKSTKTVINGSKGYWLSRKKKTEMSDATIDMYFAHPLGFIPLYYTWKDPEVKGKVFKPEIIDNKSVQKVVLNKNKNGMIITYYFDYDTGLVMKFESEFSSATGDMYMITTYEDYRDFGGYLLPSRTISNTTLNGKKKTIESKLINVKINHDISDDEFK